MHWKVAGHIRTINSGGEYHMAYSEDSSQVNDPKWVFIPPRVCAALLTPLWISVTIHCPGRYSSMTCTTLVGWLLVGNVTILGKCWRSKWLVNVLQPCYFYPDECFIICIACMIKLSKYMKIVLKPLRTLVGNNLADHSDVVGVSHVGAAPTASLFLA